MAWRCHAVRAPGVKCTALTPSARLAAGGDDIEVHVAGEQLGRPLVDGCFDSFCMIIVRGIEGGDVDDEAVTPVGGQYPLVGVVDPVGRDRFDLSAHAVLGAEVEHLRVSAMPPMMDR